MKPFRVGSQRHRIVSELLAGSRLHRFQAERLGCHALPSQISDLEKTGLRFDRRAVTVPTRWGADAHVMEYWLAPESYQLAARLLGLRTPTHSHGDDVEAYRRASGG